MPPCSACSSTWRCLLCQPPPQDFWHWLQSPHSESAQSLATTTPQTCVSLSVALHGAPSKVGGCATSLLRCRWPFLPFMPQALHSAQSVSTQSLRSGFSSTQRFVSPRAPLQGWPHSLFTVAMLRCRSQRPVDAGALQLLQTLNTQSWGTHGGVHGCMLGHSLTFSCAPWQRAPALAKKRKLSGMACRLRARLRMSVPWPQPALQPLGSDHSVQEQKSAFSQVPVQLETSLALRRSHMVPQWLGICSIERWR
mmetsp:Transcript_2930/g.8702  ORF Transcript_2930/g.8702 Transcript_2930/m.8702 type:complete len:252 (-) Transcript_2930:690-1445(-)